MPLLVGAVWLSAAVVPAGAHEATLHRLQAWCLPYQFEAWKAQAIHGVEESLDDLAGATAEGPRAAEIQSLLKARETIARAGLARIRATTYRECSKLKDEEIEPIQAGLQPLFSLGNGDVPNVLRNLKKTAASCDRAKFEETKKVFLFSLDEQASYIQWNLFPTARVPQNLVKRLTNSLADIAKAKAQVAAVEFEPCDQPQQQQADGESQRQAQGEEQHQQQEGSGGEEQQEQQQQQQTADEGGPQIIITPRLVIHNGSLEQRLARDVGGDFLRDVSTVEQDGSGWGIDGSVVIPVDGFAYLSRIGFGVTYLNVDGDSAGGSPEGTQDQLGLVGLGVFGTNPGDNRAGYQLPYNGGLNAHSFQYTFWHQETAFEGFVGTELPVPAAVTWELYLGGGLRTGFISNGDDFRVSVPGYLLDATYKTDTDVLTVGGFLDLTASFAPPSASLIQSAYVRTRLGFDVNNADSNVTFALDSPGTQDFQQVDVSRSYVTPRFAFEAGLTFDAKQMLPFAPLDGFQFTTGLRLEFSGGAPGIQLPGEGEKPTIDAGWSDDLIAIFRVQRPF